MIWGTVNNKKFQITFSPVTLWLHREEDTEAVFVNVLTENGKKLKLTEKHLIMRSSCLSNRHFLPQFEETVFANELQEGDCLIAQDKAVFETAQSNFLSEHLDSQKDRNPDHDQRNRNLLSIDLEWENSSQRYFGFLLQQCEGFPATEHILRG